MNNFRSANEKYKQVLAVSLGLVLAATTVSIIDTNIASAQMTSPSNTTGSGANSATAANNTQLSSTLEPTCLDQNATSTAQSTNTTTSASNATTGSSNSSSQAVTSATSSGTNNTSSNGSNGANVTAIGEASGSARMHLIEACNAIEANNSQLALVHLNLVARALDNISGNLTSSTSLPTSTSTSSVGNSTSSNSGDGNSGGNSTNPLDQLRKFLGLE